MPGDRTTPRLPRAILGILLATLLTAGGYGLAFGGSVAIRAGAWILAAGNAMIVACMMALGAPRDRRGPAVRIALVVTGIVLLSAFALALGLPADESATSILWLGLPRRAAAVLYGAGVVPMLALPFLFLWSFNEAPFDDRRLEELKRLRPEATRPMPDATTALGPHDPASDARSRGRS